jgi:hypothetical protein
VYRQRPLPLRHAVICIHTAHTVQVPRTGCDAIPPVSSRLHGGHHHATGRMSDGKSKTVPSMLHARLPRRPRSPHFTCLCLTLPKAIGERSDCPCPAPGRDKQSSRARTVNEHGLNGHYLRCRSSSASKLAATNNSLSRTGSWAPSPQRLRSDGLPFSFWKTHTAGSIKDSSNGRLHFGTPSLNFEPSAAAAGVLNFTGGHDCDSAKERNNSGGSRIAQGSIPRHFAPPPPSRAAGGLASGHAWQDWLPLPRMGTVEFKIKGCLVSP